MKKIIKDLIFIMSFFYIIMSSFTLRIYAEDSTENSDDVNMSVNFNEEESDVVDISYKVDDFEGEKNKVAKDFGGAIEKYKIFVVGIFGLLSIIMVGVFIVHLMNIANNAINPMKRTQALSGLLWSGIAFAILGSITLVTGLLWNIFR